MPSQPAVNTVQPMLNPDLTKLMVDARIADLHRSAAARQLLLARATQLRGNRRPNWRRRLLDRATARARTASPALVSGATSQTHRLED